MSEATPLRLIDVAELPRLAGQLLGVSRWITIEQARINAFADVTFDQQWIHVDVARAQQENGGTIAHGFLALSMMSGLVSEVWEVRGAHSVINYGFDRLRFLLPIATGSTVRLRETLLHVARRERGLLMRRESRLEIQGADRPAIVAHWLALIHL